MKHMLMKVRVLSIVGASFVYGSLMGTSIAQTAQDSAPPLQLAQNTDDAIEKQAFEAAKELGTVEAWDAFLSNYQKGFRADLARAYVKNLANQQGAAARATPDNAPASAVRAPMMKPSIGMLELAPAFSSVANISRAAKRPCVDAATLASKSSADPARISFINYSPDPVDVFWIDETGAQQLYGQINKGRQATVETFVTQPWVLKHLNGTCLMIVLPGPGPQIFTVGEALGGSAASSSKSSSSSKSQSASTAAAAPKEAKSARTSSSSNSDSCGSGRIRVEGKCMTASQAVSFCGPGYRVAGSSCVQQKSASNSNSCGPDRIRVEGKCMSRSQAFSFCGPGYRVVGSSCVHQNNVPTANKPTKPQCPKGQVWSKAELCHYDD